MKIGENVKVIYYDHVADMDQKAPLVCETVGWISKIGLGPPRHIIIAMDHCESLDPQDIEPYFTVLQNDIIKILLIPPNEELKEVEV